MGYYEKVNESRPPYLQGAADVPPGVVADLAAKLASASRAVPTPSRPAPMRDHLLLCDERLQRVRERGSAFGVPRTVGATEWFLLGSAAVHALAAIAQALEGGIRDAIEQVRPAHSAAEPPPGRAQSEGTG